MKAKQRKKLFFFDQTIRQLKYEKERKWEFITSGLPVITFDHSTESRAVKNVKTKKDWTDWNVFRIWKCRWRRIREMIERKLSDKAESSAWREEILTEKSNCNFCKHS